MSNLDDDSDQIEDTEPEGDISQRIRELVERNAPLLGKRVLSAAEFEQFRAVLAQIAELQQTVRGTPIIQTVFDDSGDEEEATEPIEVPRFLEEEQVEESRRFATARTKLFKSEWSPDFVHGSDMLIPVCQLAEHILRPGEWLTHMKSMRWHKIVTCNMQLDMYERERPLDDVDVSGSFQTSNGRTLYFSGRQLPEHPVKTNEPPNGIAASMQCSTARQRDGTNQGVYNLHLHNPPEIMGRLLNDSPPIMVATLVELLNYGIVLFRNDKYPPGEARLDLVAEVRNLPIPENIQDLLSFQGALQLHPSLEQMRRGKSGMELIPISFRFPQQIQAGEILLAHTTEPEVIRGHLADIRMGNNEPEVN